jgi:hypothetical protein
MTASARMKSVIALMPLVLVAGCVQPSPKMPEATEIERELCIQWRDSLPSRSRQDTERTQQEIGYGYDVQAMACPLWPRFPQ